MENWDDLKYILAIHRHGSLSAAARHLHVNHATVSRRITALEDKMGVRLFDRLPDGLKASEHGTFAAQTAEKVERHILDLDVALASKDTHLAGPLKISAPQLIIQLQLSSILHEFTQQYPQIELSIVGTSDLVNLYRREADISLRALKKPEETLWGRRVVRQNCAYYGATEYLHNRPDKHKLACINFSWHSNTPAPEVLAHYPEARVVAKFDDMVSVVGAVQAHMGIARMPCFIGDAQPDFQRVRKIDLAPYHDLWLLTHPDLRKVPRIRAFMDFAAKKLQDRQSIFLGN